MSFYISLHGCHGIGSKAAECALHTCLPRSVVASSFMPNKKRSGGKFNRWLSPIIPQTRRGYVYVISNIGSFGEEIYKIGLTRRLEPLDRVRELGDASVPFSFDVHAMIFSEDAPTLESTLHKVFNQKRLNQVNYRKEFFNVSLDEIKAKAIEISGKEIDFKMTVLAEEYKESLRLRGLTAKAELKN